MKKIRNFIVLSILLATMLLTLSGCDTKTSYTYDVETGDKIKIELKTNGGYSMTSDLPIEISKDDEVISQGTFGKKEAYDLYYKIVKEDSKATLIEEKNKDNIEYIFYEYNDSEYNYIIKIKDSKTCFILANNKSKESAQEVFKNLKFEVE